MHVAAGPSRAVRERRSALADAPQRAVDRLGPVARAPAVACARRQQVGGGGPEETLARTVAGAPAPRDREHQLDQPAVEQRVTHLEARAGGPALLGLELEAVVRARDRQVGLPLHVGRPRRVVSRGPHASTQTYAARPPGGPPAPPHAPEPPP